MEVVIVPSMQEAGRLAAGITARAVRSRPEAVLGVATVSAVLMA